MTVGRLRAARLPGVAAVRARLAEPRAAVAEARDERCTVAPPTPSAPPDAHGRRPRVVGKLLRFGDQTLVRGVTYGTFRPDAKGDQFPGRDVVARDFALMASHGVNAVR